MNDCPTTLYQKERGLSVSFNSLENPASAGFLLSGVSHVPAINNPRMSRVFYSLKCVTMRKMVPLILPKE